MPRLCVSMLLWVVLLGLLSLIGAEETAGEEGKAADLGREKRSMPNWALTSSDFFGWVEALREYAGYEKIEDLSRTFWAHFPSASRLGYELSDPDEE
ncbi:otospiralin-like isoform X1 [Oncorhynchus mykiss]|uniref:otospiralin-like n=1 Tax=Oncorhynchus clarkii lewisi TaxID=490388 RepID=UPI000B4EAD72|nr:otospiralin-like isoform X1 [Oncorhynchus mykiss]XP_021464418.1 otospiralin-like isoform X1 [Oncorhynchus mykiss]